MASGDRTFCVSGLEGSPKSRRNCSPKMSNGLDVRSFREDGREDCVRGERSCGGNGNGTDAIDLTDFVTVSMSAHEGGVIDSNVDHCLRAGCLLCVAGMCQGHQGICEIGLRLFPSAGTASFFEHVPSVGLEREFSDLVERS